MGLLVDVGDAGLGMLAVFWLSTVVAVRRDASARIANRAGVHAATALAAFVPFIGAFVWTCLRPQATRRDRYERRRRLALTEGELGGSSAPKRCGR
jgi:uncharacterized membrane protein YhaH (DUF805 family)